MLHEMSNFSLRMSARDDRQGQIYSARLLNHLTALERVGDCHQKATRLAEIGGGDHLRVGGVAGESLDPGGPEIGTASSSSSITKTGMPRSRIALLALGAAVLFWFFRSVIAMERAGEEPLLSTSLFHNRTSEPAGPSRRARSG